MNELEELLKIIEDSLKDVPPMLEDIHSLQPPSYYEQVVRALDIFLQMYETFIIVSIFGETSAEFLFRSKIECQQLLYPDWYDTINFQAVADETVTKDNTGQNDAEAINQIESMIFNPLFDYRARLKAVKIFSQYAVPIYDLLMNNKVVAHQALANRFGYFFSVYVTQDFQPCYQILYLDKTYNKADKLKFIKKGYFNGNSVFLYIIDATSEVKFIELWSRNYQVINLSPEKKAQLLAYTKLLPASFKELQPNQLAYIQSLINHSYRLDLLPRGALTPLLEKIFQQCHKTEEECRIITLQRKITDNKFDDLVLIFNNNKEWIDFNYAYVFAEEELSYLDKKLKLIYKIKTLSNEELAKLENKYDLIMNENKIFNFDKNIIEFITNLTFHQRASWIASSTIYYTEKDINKSVSLTTEEHNYYQEFFFKNVENGGDPALFSLLLIHNLSPKFNRNSFTLDTKNRDLLKKYLKTNFSDKSNNEINLIAAGRKFYLEICALYPWLTTTEKSNLRGFIEDYTNGIVNDAVKNSDNEENPAIDFKYVLAKAAYEQQEIKKKNLYIAYRNRLQNIISYDKFEFSPYYRECDLILSSCQDENFSTNNQKNWLNLTLGRIPGNARYAYVFTSDGKIFYINKKTTYQAVIEKEWLKLDTDIFEEFKKYFKINKMPAVSSPGHYTDARIAFSCHRHKLSEADLEKIELLLGHRHVRMKHAEHNLSCPLWLDASLLPVANPSASLQDKNNLMVFPYFMPPVKFTDKAEKTSRFLFSSKFINEGVKIQLRADSFINREGNSLLHELAKNYQTYLTQTTLVPNNTGYFACAVLLRLGGLTWEMLNYQGETVYEYSGLNPDDVFVCAVEKDVERGMSYLALRLREFAKEYQALLEERQEKQGTLTYKFLNFFGSYLLSHQQQRYEELTKLFGTLLGTEKLFNHQELLAAIEDLLNKPKNFYQGILSSGEFLRCLGSIHSDIHYATVKGLHVTYNRAIHNGVESLFGNAEIEMGQNLSINAPAHTVNSLRS